MALNRLCAGFRQITICRPGIIVGRYCSSYQSRGENDALPWFVSNNAAGTTCPETRIKFAPRTLNIDFGNLDNASKRNIIETPFKNIPSMEEPLQRRPIQHDLPLEDRSMELPPTENTIEKLAVRMIVIRRQKMKKHKRRKMRKRLQFVMAKIRNRRNTIRENAFQAELIAKIKEAEMFDAKSYVNEKLTLLQKEFIPRSYKGEILPQSMIKHFLEEKEAAKERRRNKFRLKLD